MDSPSVATVATGAAVATFAEATFAAEAATEAGCAEAAVVVGNGSVVAAVVESLGDGGLSDTEALASSEGNSLVGGSLGGESDSGALLADELTLLETDDGCLGFTTWDFLAAAESLDRSVRSAGGIEASRDEGSTELLESGTS